jgi:hypothetical protein
MSGRVRSWYNETKPFDLTNDGEIDALSESRGRYGPMCELWRHPLITPYTHLTLLNPTPHNEHEQSRDALET